MTIRQRSDAGVARVTPRHWRDTTNVPLRPRWLRAGGVPNGIAEDFDRECEVSRARRHQVTATDGKVPKSVPAFGVSSRVHVGSVIGVGAVERPCPLAGRGPSGVLSKMTPDRTGESDVRGWTPSQTSSISTAEAPPTVARTAYAFKLLG
jgi:hypothetical protein